MFRRTPDSRGAAPADARGKGAHAEDLALAHLRAHGLQLIARNVGFRCGEIDLILRDRDEVVFTEVRQRQNDAFGGSAASVDQRKCARIARAARLWLAGQPALGKQPCRFDVIAITGDGRAARIEWLRAAFTLDDLRR